MVGEPAGGSGPALPGPPERSSRRRVLGIGAALFAAGTLAGAGGALVWAGESRAFRGYLRRRQREALAALAAEVVPPDGVELPLRFGDSVQRLVAAGAIAPARFERLYAPRGGLPEWVRALFEGASEEPLRISAGNASLLLNLLWPLGLANRTGFNARSPLAGPDGGRFASTGGWTLGARPGGELFNSAAALALDAEAEAAVEQAARASFRPCCDNSAFFQDCNHGSALLGLYQLAAAEGARPAALFRIGKIANSYWYPRQYLAAALYFRAVEDLAWREVDPARVMSRRYSSASGWRRNVDGRLRAAGLRPDSGSSGGAGCAV